MIEGGIVVRRSWRSQWRRMIIFLVLSAASIFLSSYFPQSVIQGKLFPWGSQEVILVLPLFSLLPLFGLFNLMLPVYDGSFTIDNRGLETRIGILSLHQDITRIRYEDIRSIELMQSLMERALNVGTLAIGSAATGGIEIFFDGIAMPKELKNLIQQERDRRLRRTTPSEVTQQAVGGE